jgi:hypothetical protein
MKTSALVLLLLAPLAASGPACQRELPTREPAPPATSESAPPLVTPSAAPVAEVPIADAAPDAVADASSDVSAVRAFGPAPSTTPGQILCGNERCDLKTQVCCENEARAIARCVPSPVKDQYACDNLEGATEKHCDEKADCPGSQSCCMTWGCSGGCPPVATCSDMPCWHGPEEQCLPGGSCSAGFVCRKSGSSRTGYCFYDKASVACGKQRCSGDKPVCCWNTKTKTGECAESCAEEENEDLWALSCTNPDDCGGYPCANFVPSPRAFTRCMGSYDVPDRSTVVFCRSIKDCPQMNMLGKPKACLADKSFPGKAKTCRYPQQ